MAVAVPSPSHGDPAVAPFEAGSTRATVVSGISLKLNLSLPPDLARRFGVHAEMMGMSKSDLFAELVRAGCKRFVVSDRERAAEDLAEPDAA